MANISEDLDSEDLDSLKFLLSSTLTREKIENSKVMAKIKHVSFSFTDVVLVPAVYVCVCVWAGGFL